MPVPGERELSEHIAYGIPDVLGRERHKYSGTRVLVVGSGHSAFNVVLDLLTLSEDAPATDVVWVMRRDNLDTVWGGGSADALGARGELGQRAKRAVESGRLRVLTPYRIRSIAKSAAGLAVTGIIRDAEVRVDVDSVIVCTGFPPRPIAPAHSRWRAKRSAHGHSSSCRQRKVLLGMRQLAGPVRADGAATMLVRIDEPCRCRACWH